MFRRVLFSEPFPAFGEGISVSPVRVYAARLTLGHPRGQFL